jgi:ribonuclease BN (tRNA processing enzyme)
MLARIINWSTGVKGEATAIHFPCARRLQFVDLGCWFFCKHCAYRCAYAYDTIHNDLHRLCNSSTLDTLDLVLTHLHADHYSLAPLIPYCCNSSKINAVNIYIPGIPHKPPEVRDVALKLLVLEDIALKTIARSVGEALEPIIEWLKLAHVMSKVIMLYRGNTVDINGGMYIRIVWPPEEFPLEKLGRKIEEEIIEIVELLKKACELAKEQELFKELCKDVESIEKTVEKLSNNLEELHKNKEKEKGYVTVPPDSDLAKYLLPTIIYPPLLDVYHYYSELELIMMALFRISNALNDFSLILEYYYINEPIIVIPGDDSDDVLNYVGDLEKKIVNIVGINVNVRDVVFLRGAHHGTHYGKYLSLFNPSITWLSEYEPNCNSKSTFQYRHEYWGNVSAFPNLLLS